MSDYDDGDGVEKTAEYVYLVYQSCHGENHLVSAWTDEDDALAEAAAGQAASGSSGYWWNVESKVLNQRG